MNRPIDDSSPGPADDAGGRRTPDGVLQTGALRRAIFNSAMFSKIATDAEGVIQIFNVGAERMLGYAAADVTNRITPADISDPDELVLRAEALSAEFGRPIGPGFEALVFKASRGIEDIYELTYVRKDGTRLPAVVSVTALRDVGEAIIGYLLIGTDNTARKQAERARQDLNGALARATRVAEQANLAKSDFLSSMSHELRSPLNAILGFAQLIDSGVPAPNPAQKESVDQILQAGWYLLALINEILDLSLIESGKLSLSPESVSLDEVLLDCQSMIEPQARQGGIRVAFAGCSGFDFVKADRTRLKQIFVNLLSNAIKYNRAGGLVEVGCSDSGGGRTRISFRDTGAGLSAAQIGQLFQPFNRLGQENGSEQGTGIGLVVCKRLAELMGGAIGVDSTLGLGSVFWVEFDAAAAPALAAEVDAPDPASLASQPGAEPVYTVLCVEDNPANLMLIERLVGRRRDIRLLHATDGHAAIDIAREMLPDLILMDINLPGISGITALRILSDMPATAAIPVIALSANAMPHDIEKGLAAGFFHYLTKPIRVVEFMATIDTVLQRARAPAC